MLETKARQVKTVRSVERNYGRGEMTKRTTYASRAFVLSAAFLIASSPSLAKAYHPPAREMIKQAEFIAVVSLDEPVSQQTSGKWNYGEVSDAHLERSV